MFLSTLVGAALAVVVGAQNPYTSAKDANGHSLPAYSPVRPPAIPLAVRSPYTNAWSSTVNNGTLNTNGVIFWPGQGLGWEGMVTVDGVSYEYLGTGSQSLPSLPTVKTAIPLSVSYDSQYSNFTFAAGPVVITASFLSSVLPTDLCRTSIPLSYLTTSVQSTDGAAHNVQFYSDVNAAWIAPESNKTIEWNLYQGGSSVNGSGNATKGASAVYTWLFHLQHPYEFGEEMDLPLWGNFSYSSSPGQASNFSFQSGFSNSLRFNFAMQHSLQDIVDPNYRGAGAREPVFAYAHDFGSVSSASVVYSIGTIQQPIMRYLTNGGIIPLQPWWNKCYGDIFQMINFHYNDFAQTQQLAAQWDSQLKADVDAYYKSNNAMVYSNSTPSAPPVYSNGSRGYASGTDEYGEEYIFDPNTGYGFLDPSNFTGIAIPDVEEAEAYYAIVALSARQVMGAYVLAIPPTGGCSSSSSNASEPLMFQKEISSDGNVNTVDVMYPAMPFFLYANPELLRYNLEPLFQNQEGGFYPNGYSMHDIGTHFPNATGHVEGNDEYMPVEESGNMILMAYAYYKFSGNAQYLKQHYPKLNQFAQYLIEYSLTPGIQLSTDDFAGQLVNQTNLAIKGIVGLQAMASVATVTGATSDAQNFSTTAANYIQQWEYFAVDPSGRHTLLSYEWRSSYGLLYNIYPDKLLSLNIVPQRIYDMQSAWYPTISQVFGVPLDTRHSYTKSDWEMWTAATCSPSTRRLFVNALAYWLNNTVTDRPFSDLYETIDEGSYPVSPGPIFFNARPVAGGHFSLLALEKVGQDSTTGTKVNGTGSGSSSSSSSSSPPFSMPASMSSASTASASSAFGLPPPVVPVPVPVPGNTTSSAYTVALTTLTTLRTTTTTTTSSSMPMYMSGSMTTSTVPSPTSSSMSMSMSGSSGSSSASASASAGTSVMSTVGGLSLMSSGGAGGTATGGGGGGGGASATGGGGGGGGGSSAV